MASTHVHALTRLEEALAEIARTPVELERPSSPEHGDYATNVALRIAPARGQAPRELAAEIASAAVERGIVESAEPAGPGFVNLHVSDAWIVEALQEVLDAGERFGAGSAASPERVQVELVSANPTGPLTVAHGRNGAYGDSVARLLAFAGRLGPQKSLDVALEAVAAVPGVTLAIAGDGPDRASLERRARELGLEERARFLGSLPRDRILRLFRAADAAVLSSSWENFPHTVVEALAVGTPVVSTAVGGVPEVVADGENGLLVPPGDPAALAAAVERLFDDDALRARLARAAAPSVAGHTEEATFARIEEELLRAAAA